MFLTREGYSDDILKIADLFQNSFNRKISVEFLHWRYLQNPLNEVLDNVSFDEEKLVANYSASPCILSIDGNFIKSGLSMTTMTDPNYTGRGLFTQLAMDLYQLMSEENYSIIWGFPNRNSHPNFIKRLDWLDIYEIPTMRLNLNYFEKGINESESIVITDNNFKLDYSFSCNVKDGLIKVLKNQEYLQWRYYNNPVNNYVNFVLQRDGIVSSFCVVKVYGKELDIVDFQAIDKDHGMILLSTAIDYAVELKLNSINCWAPRHHFFHSLCERLGFTNQEPITYFGGKILEDNGFSSRIFNFSNWYIQMGDSDVY